MNPPTLPHAVWQSLQFEWLWVYRGDVPRAEVWSNEITVPAGWFWVERGLAKIETHGQLLTLKPGQSFFSAPGIRRQWFASGTRLLSVGLRCLTPDGLPLFQEGLNVAGSLSASKPLLKATQTLFRAIHGRKRLISFKQASAPAARCFTSWCDHEAAFLQWFRTYLRTLERLGVHATSTHRSGDPRLDQIIDALNDWPLSQPFHLASLAQPAGLGERRTRDLLRARLGMTPQNWIERRRIDWAQNALTNDSSPIKEVAFALGFRYPSHFTAWFKRATSLNPTAFRTACSPLEAA